MRDKKPDSMKVSLFGVQLSATGPLGVSAAAAIVLSVLIGRAIGWL